MLITYFILWGIYLYSSFFSMLAHNKSYIRLIVSIKKEAIVASFLESVISVRSN